MMANIIIKTLKRLKMGYRYKKENGEGKQCNVRIRDTEPRKTGKYRGRCKEPRQKEERKEKGKVRGCQG